MEFADPVAEGFNSSEGLSLGTGCSQRGSIRIESLRWRSGSARPMRAHYEEARRLRRDDLDGGASTGLWANGKYRLPRPPDQQRAASNVLAEVRMHSTASSQHNLKWPLSVKVISLWSPSVEVAGTRISPRSPSLAIARAARSRRLQRAPLSKLELCTIDATSGSREPVAGIAAVQRGSPFFRALGICFEERCLARTNGVRLCARVKRNDGSRQQMLDGHMHSLGGLAALAPG